MFRHFLNILEHMKKTGGWWMVQQTPVFLADLGDEIMSL